MSRWIRAPHALDLTRHQKNDARCGLVDSKIDDYNRSLASAKCGGDRTCECHNIFLPVMGGQSDT